MTELRLMVGDDVVAAEETWSDALNTMRTAHGLPVEARTADAVRRLQARIGHLLAVDPAGSWVAEDDDGQLIGLAQAIVRDDLWVLSLLGVATRCQENGVGKALLDAALNYGKSAQVGMIFCSRDPRAMRRYARAGFDLHPSLTALGHVDRRQLHGGRGVREGGPGDLDFVADLDRRSRGGSHGPDVDHLMEDGCRLLVLDECGYALVRGAKPVVLAAENEDAASELLRGTLLDARHDEVVEINWITSAQQWAVQIALEAGLVLHPVGPVMTRGIDGPPPCYLPSGAYG